MDTIKNKTTVVGVVTLIVGLALGLGIGVWSARKGHASNAPAAKSHTTSTAKIDKQDTTATNGMDEWDPFRQMERMQQEIDRAIRNATEQFQGSTDAMVFRPDAGYSSQFDLHDRKDHFELRAYLPDAEASDVNVKIDNDRILRVTVDHKKHEVKKDSAHEASVTELGQYEQIVTLPEAVRSADMKVERKGHEVIVTIPKAKNS